MNNFPDYEAVAAILATDSDHDWDELAAESRAALAIGGEEAKYDPSVLLTSLYLETAKEIVAAALGDEPLYEKRSCDGDHFIPKDAQCLEPTWVQVWPKEDSNG